jgi:hypothetical protein
VTDYFKGDQLPKFGHGAFKTEECNCDHIRVFMRRHDHLSVDQRRVILDKSTKLKDVKNSFGADMKQELIFDENFFRFHANDLEKPLWMFSSGCNLNLSFVYESQIKEVLSATGNWFSWQSSSSKK